MHIRVSALSLRLNKNCVRDGSVNVARAVTRDATGFARMYTRKTRVTTLKSRSGFPLDSAVENRRSRNAEEVNYKALAHERASEPRILTKSRDCNVAGNECGHEDACGEDSARRTKIKKERGNCKDR